MHTEEPKNFVLRYLRDMRAEMIARSDADEKRLSRIESRLGLLADSIVSVRNDVQDIRDDMQAMCRDIQTLSIAFCRPRRAARRR